MVHPHYQADGLPVNGSSDAGGNAAATHRLRRGFICAGCWTLDRVKLIDAWPEEESLAMIDEIDRQGGGSAHNVGIGLKRIDASMPVEGIGLLGHDADGDFLDVAEDALLDWVYGGKTAKSSSG